VWIHKHFILINISYTIFSVGEQYLVTPPLSTPVAPFAISSSAKKTKIVRFLTLLILIIYGPRLLCADQDKKRERGRDEALLILLMILLTVRRTHTSKSMAGGISLKTIDNKQVDGKTRFPKRPQLCFYLICVCHLRCDLLSDIIVEASVGYFLVYKHSYSEIMCVIKCICSDYFQVQFQLKFFN
jgi:hypothetical protein